MKRFIFVVLSVFLPAKYVFSEIIPIVSASNCETRGPLLRKCTQENITANFRNFDRVFIPLEMNVSTRVGASCRTPYPIYVVGEIDGDEVFRRNIFNTSAFSLDQAEFSSITLVVEAPYSNIASFQSSCVIELEYSVDNVNVEELASLKVASSEELLLVNELIALKSGLLSLTEVVQVYVSVVELAEGDLNDFYVLDDILQVSCINDPELCTWTDKINVILFDGNISLTFPQQMMLFSLASSLDELVPTDCDDEGCVADLVSDDVTDLINTILSGLPPKEETELSLEENIRLGVQLENDIREYRSIAEKNGIEWEDL